MSLAILILVCGVYLWLSGISTLATIIGIIFTIIGYVYVSVAQKIVVDGIIWFDEFRKKYEPEDEDEMIISFKQDKGND